MSQQTNQEKPALDPHPLSPYVAWAGNRNKDPILEVLKKKLPNASANVFEFATGSGMHINYFAPHFKHLQFQPSDKDTEVFDNIKKLTKNNGNKNISDPVHIDLTTPETWSGLNKKGDFSAIFCINIFQVAPISIADGMMACASYLLNNDGFLMIYGPFQDEGNFSTASNKEFHETLSSFGVNEWGLKDIGDLRKAAEKHGMTLKEKIDMPANNFSLIFSKK
jgi:hypothetical protein